MLGERIGVLLEGGLGFGRGLWGALGGWGLGKAGLGRENWWSAAGRCWPLLDRETESQDCLRSLTIVLGVT